MIGGSLVEVRRGGARYPGLRRGAPARRMGQGPIIIAGNRVPDRHLKRIRESHRLRSLSPIRGSMGGFHPAVFTQNMVFTPGLTIRQTSMIPGTVTHISDRVVSFDVHASIDDSMKSATVRLARGSGVLSLSPLISTSIYRDAEGRPLLDPGSEIFLDVACNPPDDPTSTTGVNIFYGRIDEVNAAAAPGIVEISCRDAGAFYQNVTISEGSHYGNAVGREASLVMQDILQDYGFDHGRPLLARRRRLARRGLPTARDGSPRRAQGHRPAGGPRRALLRESTEARLLRAGARESLETRRTSNSVSNAIRNSPISSGAMRMSETIGTVRYLDANGTAHGPFTSQDADSILRYGNGKARKARIILNGADNIRNDVDAQRFADAALLDTKDPFASHGIRGPGLPMVELNDSHRYAPTNDEYDAAQYVAVAEYDHHYENGHLETTVYGRGNRIAAFRAYRQSEQPPVIVSTELPVDGLPLRHGTLHAMVTDLTWP
jgi:hypothetical protein